jgi:arsenite oxidase small subunit
MNNKSFDSHLPEHPSRRNEQPLSRRDLLKLGGGAAASAAALAGVAPSAAAQTQGARGYPVTALGRATGLQNAAPMPFNYPDAASPCVLLKTGSPAPGGVGPQRDIVAFSILCTHRGCAVAYDAAARTFKCPCHFSIFDPEKGGQQVCGQATVNLPQVMLDYDAAADRISAVGIEGLIYGRVANLLDSP